MLEEIIVENFPKMGKEIATQVQETQRVPSRINLRWNTPRKILIRLTKIKHKEQILKAAREKQQITHKIRSDQISRSVVSDSLRPHESQHARPPGPSPTPGVQSDSRPSSQWCHPAISYSVVPFSSCPQSLPASESFPMSQLFAWGGQSTGVSALASFLPRNTQGWSPSEWTGLDLLAVQGTLKSLLQHINY